jgi:hypothetical protein
VIAEYLQAPRRKCKLTTQRTITRSNTGKTSYNRFRSKRICIYTLCISTSALHLIITASHSLCAMILIWDLKILCKYMRLLCESLMAKDVDVTANCSAVSKCFILHKMAGATISNDLSKIRRNNSEKRFDSLSFIRKSFVTHSCAPCSTAYTQSFLYIIF